MSARIEAQRTNAHRGRVWRIATQGAFSAAAALTVVGAGGRAVLADEPAPTEPVVAVGLPPVPAPIVEVGLPPVPATSTAPTTVATAVAPVAVDAPAPMGVSIAGAVAAAVAGSALDAWLDA